jgi:hypothetical protein
MPPKAPPGGLRAFASVRPGLDGYPQQLIMERAQAAFEASVEASREELPPMIRGLTTVEGVGPTYSPDALRELMKRANDLRGVALMLGSEPTADVAHAIFELAEGALPTADAPAGHHLPRSLVTSFAQSCLHLVDPARPADQGEFLGRLKALLAEARQKLAGDRLG